MSSNKKLVAVVERIVGIFKLHFVKFNEMPIQKGYKFYFKKGFPIVWIKVTRQELDLLKKMLKNEK